MPTLLAQHTIVQREIDSENVIQHVESKIHHCSNSPLQSKKADVQHDPHEFSLDQL
jgi:hypothetical protein